MEEVSSDEAFFNPGWFGDDYYKLYSIGGPKPVLNFAGAFDSDLTIMLYQDNNKIVHSRAIYNILDFLGDVGGLLDALKLIAGTIVGLIMRGNLTG